MSSHPPIKHEEVIERLISENRQYLSLINDIKLVLTNESEFDGLSIIGGIKSLMTKYIEDKNTIYELKQKIKKLEK